MSKVDELISKTSCDLNEILKKIKQVKKFNQNCKLEIFNKSEITDGSSLDKIKAQYAVDLTPLVQAKFYKKIEKCGYNGTLTITNYGETIDSELSNNNSAGRKKFQIRTETSR